MPGPIRFAWECLCDGWVGRARLGVDFSLALACSLCGWCG